MVKFIYKFVYVTSMLYLYTFSIKEIVYDSLDKVAVVAETEEDAWKILSTVPDNGDRIHLDEDYSLIENIDTDEWDLDSVVKVIPGLVTTSDRSG